MAGSLTQLGAVTHVGTGSSVLSFAYGPTYQGAGPSGAYAILVTVTVGTNVDVADGIAQIAYSTDGGRNTMPVVTVPSSGIVPMPGTNASLVFTVTGTLVAGDTYEAPSLGSSTEQNVANIQSALFTMPVGFPGLPIDPTTFTWNFGAEYIVTENAPPRVVWVETFDEYTAAVGVGGNPRHLRTRTATLEAHCWGSTRLQREQISRTLVVGIYRYAHGTFQLHKGVYPDETGPDRGSFTNFGFRYIFTFTLDIPLLDVGTITGKATKLSISTNPSS